MGGCQRIETTRPADDESPVRVATNIFSSPLEEITALGDVEIDTSPYRRNRRKQSSEPVVGCEVCADFRVSEVRSSIPDDRSTRGAMARATSTTRTEWPPSAPGAAAATRPW